MANKRISQLATLDAPSIDAVIPVVDAGATKKTKLRRVFHLGQFSPDGTAAGNTTALTNAINAAHTAGGGVVYIPYGDWTFNSFTVTSKNNVTLRGDGYGTRLAPAQAGSNIAVTTCDRFTIENLTIERLGANAGGAAIAFDRCTRSGVRKLSIRYVAQCIIFTGCLDYFVEGLDAERLIAGGAQGAIHVLGTSSDKCRRGKIKNVRCINIFNRNGGEGPFQSKAWAATTAFSVGDIQFSTDRWWECTAAGTSGSDSTIFNNIPGTTTVNAFTTDVVDGGGSLRWRFLGGNSYVIDIDSYVEGLQIDGVRVWGGSRSIGTRNAVGGGVAPTDIQIANVKSRFGLSIGIAFEHGTAVELSNFEISESVTGPALMALATFGGGLEILGGRVNKAWQQGIKFQDMSQAADANIANVHVKDANQSNGGSIDGIDLGNNSNVQVKNCKSTGANCRYGIGAGATASAYQITGNDVDGNLTQGVNHSFGATSITERNTGAKASAGTYDRRESLQSFRSTEKSRYHEIQDRVQTTDATVTTLSSLSLPNGSVATVTAHVMARKDGTDQAGYILRAVYTQEGGTAALISTVDQLAKEDQAAWDATLDASGATARVRVTGAAATTIEWWVRWTVDVFTP